MVNAVGLAPPIADPTPSRDAVRIGPAHWLLLIVPAALLLGALGFQHLGGLAPCEMCLWQRWPHLAALVLALAALLAPPPARRLLLFVAAGGVLTSGAIGLFHTGVEAHWWAGPTHCTPNVASGGDFLKAMVTTPLVRCDVAAWKLLGISMAGYNALISGAVALFAFVRLARS